MSRGLLVLVLAAGCAVPREAGFPDVQTLVSQRTGARVHWNQGTAEDAQVELLVRELWSRELSAESATQIALLNSPRLQATYEGLGVAQADLVQAGLLRNPVLSGSLHFPLSGTISGSQSAGVIGWDLNLIGDFIDLFMLPLRKRYARAELERVKLEVADAVLDTAAQVKTAFYAAQAQQQMVAMRRTIVEAAQASAELAARQHEAGNLSDLDLTNEQGLYAQARLELARTEVELMGDRERLVKLLGAWGADVDFKLGAKLPELPPSDPPLDHVESFAIAQRLDLGAARQQVEIAGAALSLTSSTRFINAVSVGAHIDKDPEGVTFAGPNLELQLPIFDQGQASVARLRGQLRQAQRLLDARSIEIRSDVRFARARLLAARSAAEYYRSTLIPIRERIVALSQQQYNAMLIGVYQLLLAKQSEVSAYGEYIDAVRDYWIARTDLERAAGGRLPELQGEKR